MAHLYITYIHLFTWCRPTAPPLYYYFLCNLWSTSIYWYPRKEKKNKGEKETEIEGKEKPKRFQKKENETVNKGKFPRSAGKNRGVVLWMDW